MVAASEHAPVATRHHQDLVTEASEVQAQHHRARFELRVDGAQHRRCCQPTVLRVAGKRERLTQQVRGGGRQESMEGAGLHEAGAVRIRHHHTTRASPPHQTGHTHSAPVMGGFERVQVRVVDPSIDDVDGLHAVEDTQPHPPGPHHHVRTLHEVDAEACREVAVFDVGRVGWPGAEHDRTRAAATGRRRRGERPA